jgi:hypothetical protein
MADASEIAFELWIDRVMYTRWEACADAADALGAQAVARIGGADRTAPASHATLILNTSYGRFTRGACELGK